MTVNLNQIQGVLSENISDLAFIVGNGINRYAYGEGKDVSWNKLLLDVWEQISEKRLASISSGVSLTEFYDIMELKAGSADKLKLKVTQLLEDFKQVEYHKWLQNKIRNLQVPLLTTNFDRNLDLELQDFKMESQAKGFTDYYPWNLYYSDKKLDSPLSGFGVWHINGMMKYRRSIRLGLSEYTSLSARVRSFLHKGDSMDNFMNKNKPYWKGDNTWLHIIFNRSLCIFGLALDENETFLRWLLIERMKYFEKFSWRKKKGWYVCRSGSLSEGKNFFLNCVGLTPVILQNYDDIYKGLVDF